ncbi:MAG: hypothetical protein KDM81_21660, partial [Verrucomicrobiae bacterium]|nr:hypothetical protein [Verrucomicrobiae bacterium]
MSARVQPAAGAWNAPRWILALALVFALEVSLVFALSWRPGGSIPAPVRPTHLRFVVDTREARRLTDLPWLPDAAQFAQTTPRGFTAGVWSLDAEAALP